jgi:membrane-bound lytic murein transglycosylase
MRSTTKPGTKGNQAEWYAGHMQSTGKYWVLLPKGVDATDIEK